MRAAILVLVAGCAAATDPHPLARNVAEDVGGKWCAHLAACYPTHYAARFPADASSGTTAACVAEGAAAIPGDRVDACDVSRIDTCRADVEAAPCLDGPALERMPSSCGGC